MAFMQCKRPIYPFNVFKRVDMFIGFNALIGDMLVSLVIIILLLYIFVVAGLKKLFLSALIFNSFVSAELVCAFKFTSFFCHSIS